MSALHILFRGAAIGAAVMYLLDPDRGRRRRAVARDKARRAASHAVAFVDAARRDARQRLRAVRVGATRWTRSRRNEMPPDVVLVERVRARLGRMVAHPHAVRVSAAQGIVQLSGPILAFEHPPLMAAVRRVRGVRDVNDEALALHRTADHVSALQGGGRRKPSGAPVHAHWNPSARLAVVGAAGLLALHARRRRGPLRIALLGAGAALVVRAATNR
jgi:hypothetical protein